VGGRTFIITAPLFHSLASVNSISMCCSSDFNDHVQVKERDSSFSCDTSKFYSFCCLSVCLWSLARWEECGVATHRLVCVEFVSSPSVITARRVQLLVHQTGFDSPDVDSSIVPAARHALTSQWCPPFGASVTDCGSYALPAHPVFPNVLYVQCIPFVRPTH